MEAFCCYLDQNVSIFIRVATIHQSMRSVFDAGSASATGAMCLPFKSGSTRYDET